MFTDYGHGYGFGQTISTKDGHLYWGHGGGINGFSTMLLRLPDDHLTVIVLSNIEQGPAGKLAYDLAALYLGGPPPATAVTLTPAQLDRYVGAFQVGPKFFLHVARDGDHLAIQATGQTALAFAPTSEREFTSRVISAKVAFDGPDSLVLSQGGLDRPGRRVDPAEATRIETAAAKTHTAVAIDPAILDRYVGVFRLNPNLAMTFTREGERLFVQATGQPKVELFAETERDFFLKVIDIQMTFDAGAKASEVVVHQGGLDTVAKRTE
jgi:hypothetical protein